MILLRSIISFLIFLVVEIQCLNGPLSSSQHESVTSRIDPSSPPFWSRRNVVKVGVMTGIFGTLFCTTTTKEAVVYAYTLDTDKLRESLYLISRVQEATVQQERFVTKVTLQEDLKQKMKLTLRLVEKNYLLLDQINYASNFVVQGGDDNLVVAVAAGNEAVEALQNAIDYVNQDLGSGPLQVDQRDYLISNLALCRDKIFEFVQFMPQDKLRQARDRVEDENVKNREEYAGDSDDGLFNPVKLPWK